MTKKPLYIVFTMYRSFFMEMENVGETLQRYWISYEENIQRKCCVLLVSFTTATPIQPFVQGLKTGNMSTKELMNMKCPKLILNLSRLLC